MNIKSIGLKLIVGSCIAVLFPLVVNGVFTSYKSSNVLSELSKEHAQSTASDVAALVRKTLEEEKKTAAAFASDYQIRSITQQVNERDIGQSTESIVLLRQEMKRKFKLLGDQYLGIFVTNSNGILYTGELANGNEYKGSDISTRSYFQEAKKSGEPVIGDVVASKSTGKLISVVCAPILSDNKDFLGVFGMSMKASFLTNLVTAKKVGNTGYAFMVNKEGIIIAHPKKDFILKLDLKTLDGMQGITQNMLAGKTGVDEYNFKNTDKIAGFAPIPSKGWSVGVTQNKKEFIQPASSLRNTTILIGILSLVIAVFVISFAAKTISTPIKNTIAGLKDIADGDLTKRLDVQTKDEIGELANWFNTSTQQLHTVIGKISEHIKLVNNASTDLSSIATDLSGNAKETSDHSNNVSVAAEEMNANLSNVAAAMEESTTNASIVASAGEEMTATIKEIADNSKNAHSMSDTAVEQAEVTSNKMAELGQAAQAISKVTEAITEISEQTNLLALNATIEAARAGEAGKGFAVVANEIKELAKQTSDATLDIKKQIGEVQNTTDSTIGEIEQITKIITSVNEIIATISSAVGEQSAATDEIANNISQVSTGLSEVNENVSQSSVVANSITHDIAGVNVTANDVSRSSNLVKENSGDLLRLADELKNIVSTFKI